MRSGRVLFAAALCGLLAFLPAPGASEETATGAIESSVVKVHVRANPPDLFSPWQKSGLQSATGTGVVIEGGSILTSAHLAENAVSVEVKRVGDPERYTASVLHVGHDCDLALLAVEDPRFHEGARALPLGELPRPQDMVQAYGFAIGGETVGVTAGIVSRVEISTYGHSLERLLLAQIDAAMNPGNSGGPVVASGRLAGIAMQTLNEAENVGYMIPVSVIQHFLRDASDGRYDGFPRLGAEFQDLESEAQRKSLGMDKGQGGTLVTQVDYGGPAWGVLEPGDVLTSLDGVAIASDMTVAWPRVGRVNFSEVYKSRQVGEEIRVGLLRDGKPVERTMRLTPHQFLVPGRRSQDEPEYLVFGGLVFQPLTVNYLLHLEPIPHALATHALHQNVVTDGKSQLILLQKVLPDAVNRGYQDWEDLVVATVDGVAPRNMEHLAEIIDSARGPWVRIVTEDRARLTLSLEQARAANASILAGFGISHDRSTGLRAADRSRIARTEP